MLYSKIELHAPSYSEKRFLADIIFKVLKVFEKMAKIDWQCLLEFGLKAYKSIYSQIGRRLP